MRRGESMNKPLVELTYWAAVSYEHNTLDGDRVRPRLFWWRSPKVEHGKVLMMFETRRACRAWIKEEFSYIGKRPDLRKEPHCWRVPKTVKVTVAVSEAA